MPGNATPSFVQPPLDEVVMGVQFQATEGYNTTFNKGVWDLFSEDYPLVEEHPVIEPQIEAFGGNVPQSFRINFGEPPAKTRLWFISKDHSHLLQFQEDRLLMNWRNRVDGAAYPRHTKMVDAFRSYINKLDKFQMENFGSGLVLTQAEVSYVNIIPMNAYGEVGEWLSFLKSGSIDIEGLNANFGQVLRDHSGQPIARVYYELQSAYRGVDRQPAVRFSLTCRGRPADTTIAAGLEFLTYGRDRIVDDFCRLTTEKAHVIWGRTDDR